MAKTMYEEGGTERNGTEENTKQDTSPRRSAPLWWRVQTVVLRKDSSDALELRLDDDDAIY
jgi:predicted phosphoadenosine phosphosulfate sulfurtransferase